MYMNTPLVFSKCTPTNRTLEKKEQTLELFVSCGPSHSETLSCTELPPSLGKTLHSVDRERSKEQALYFENIFLHVKSPSLAVFKKIVGEEVKTGVFLFDGTRLNSSCLKNGFCMSISLCKQSDERLSRKLSLV